MNVDECVGSETFRGGTTAFSGDGHDDSLIWWLGLDLVARLGWIIPVEDGVCADCVWAESKNPPVEERVGFKKAFGICSISTSSETHRHEAAATELAAHPYRIDSDFHKSKIRACCLSDLHSYSRPNMQ
ncbi:MAG: hypothetical protein ACYCSN_13285 [Acidobacteriaceae bacterium]